MTLTSKLAIAMIALVAITVAAVGWLNYRSVEQSTAPRVLDRIENQAKLAAADLASFVAGARGDVASLRSGAITSFIRAHRNGGTDPVDGVSEQTWRERINTRIAAQLEVKPAYAQIRFIGVEGREIIRVDRLGPNDSVRIVPEQGLGMRSDRTYFKETTKLRPGDIYVSALDLNRMNWSVTEPPLPTLRVASPVFDSDGAMFGFFMINLDMRIALNRVRAPAQPEEAIYVVNQKGDYLVHPDRSREFASQLGMPIESWQSDFPALASAVGTTETVSRVVPDRNGQRSGIALAPVILAGNEWVAVIETTPNKVLVASASAVQEPSLIVGLIAVLCAAALAVGIARSLTRPIIQLTKAVEGAGRDGTTAIPIDAGGETGVLARAFARVMGEARAKTIALECEVEQHRRTEAARALHAERERLFSAAVESTNDSIVTVTLDGTITSWNPAAERVTGVPAAEAVGKNVEFRVSPEFLSKHRDMIRRIGAGESVPIVEAARKRRDGSPVDISLSVSAIRSTSGAIIGAP